MRKFGAVLKVLREERNMSQRELADQLNISNSAIGMYESEKREPNYDILELIADYFNVDMNYLLGKTFIRNSYRELNPAQTDEDIYTQVNIAYIRVPLYGDISCGSGSFVDDNVIDYIAVPEDGLSSNREYFAQKASGDSMIDAGINDGDVIVFEKSNVIEDGKIGCFCIDDNVATCKKFKRGKAFIQLIPANHNYDPIVIDLQDNNFRVIGVLKKSIKSFD